MYIYGHYQVILFTVICLHNTHCLNEYISTYIYIYIYIYIKHIFVYKVSVIHNKNKNKNRDEINIFT